MSILNSKRNLSDEEKAYLASLFRTNNDYGGPRAAADTKGLFIIYGTDSLTAAAESVFAFLDEEHQQIKAASEQHYGDDSTDGTVPPVLDPVEEESYRVPLYWTPDRVVTANASVSPTLYFTNKDEALGKIQEAGPGLVLFIDSIVTGKELLIAETALDGVATVVLNVHARTMEEALMLLHGLGHGDDLCAKVIGSLKAD